VAFGLPCGIQNSQTSIGLRWDLVRFGFTWKGKDREDEKCKPATGPGSIERANAVFIEVDFGFTGTFNMFGIILSTDMLGNSLSTWGFGNGDRSGLTSFKQTLFEHCYPCGGFGCVLRYLANGLNEPLNELFVTIAEGMSFVMTEGLKVLSHHLKKEAAMIEAKRKSAMAPLPKKIDKGPGMWLFLSY
jgi:hypothetical protein